MRHREALSYSGRIRPSFARGLSLGLVSLLLMARLGWTQPGELIKLAERFAQFYKQGSYPEAEETAKEILSLLEKSRDKQDLDIAVSLNNLGSLAYAQGRLDAAENWYQRSLQLHESVAGPDHLNVAEVLYNLAGLYLERRKYEHAEALYHKSLKIRESLLGREDPSAADVLNNLGFLYLKQGKYQLADQALRRATAIWQEHSSSDNAPFAAITLNNLALLSSLRNGFAEAESLYKQALTIEEKFWGKDHPETAGTLLNLAELYRARGRIEDAVRIFQQAVAVREKALGPDNPLTIEAVRRARASGGKAGEQNSASAGADPKGIYQIILVKTRDEAEGLLDRIQKGEEFHELAMAYSIDPTAPTRGYFRARILDLRKELRSQLEPLHEGQVSGVFEMDRQWAIVKMILSPRK